MLQLNFARLKLREIFESHFPMLVNYIPRSAIIYTITNKPQANIDTEFKNKFNTLSWIQVIFSIWWYQVNFLISQLVFFDVKHLNLKKRHTDNRKGLFIFIMLLFPEAKALIIPLSVRTYRKEKTNASLQRILPVFTSRRFKTRPTLPGKDYKLFSVPPGFIPSDKSKLKYNPLMKNIVIKSTHCFFFLSIFFFQFHGIISQAHVVSVSALRCKWHYFIHSARSRLVGRYFYFPDLRRPSGRWGSCTDIFLLINSHTIH